MTIGPLTRAYAFASAALLGGLVGAATPAAQSTSSNLAGLLIDAGARVEEFFARAQSIMCTETVWIQSLNPSLTREGSGRTVESELRLSWDPGADGSPATEAQIKRQVRTVNGRTPRKYDFRNCTAPEQTESETQPLSMLLAQQREEYAFTLVGPGRVDGRRAVMVDFREMAKPKVRVYAIEDNDDCLGYDLTGGARGRLWIDPETGDVLRLDRRLGGLVDVKIPYQFLRRPGFPSYWTLERWDVSMRFGRIAFHEPDESMVLPMSSTSLNITRGSGSPRVRMETKYTDYKRFLTGGRVVDEREDAR